jgi:hypothetical protein
MQHPREIKKDSQMIMEIHSVKTVPSLIIRRVRKIAMSDYWLRHVCLSVRPSVSNPLMDFHEI